MPEPEPEPETAQRHTDDAEELEIFSPSVVFDESLVDIRAVEEEKRPMFLMDPGPKLADVVKAVNAIGASPADLVAILEALKQAGALKAELIVL